METMKENYIKGLAEAMGYNLSGGSYWKEVDNYFINLMPHEGKVYVEIKTGIGNESMPPIIGEETAIISESDKVSDCIINKSLIILSFKMDSLNYEEVEALIQSILKLLSENGVPGIIDCQVCNNSLVDSDHILIKLNNQFLKVHNSCHEKIVGDIEKRKNAYQGNYISGIVGAVVFGAIGTIPWVLVSIAGWYASILGLVIALSTNFGYNLFKGKKGKLKSATLVIVLIVMVISAGFVSQLYDLFKYLSEESITDVSIIDGLRFIIALLKEDSEYAQSFMMNTVMGVGFGLLGSWRIIKSSASDRVADDYRVEVVSTN